MINTKSYAKINLSFELLSKRDDGLHNVFSIMQTISLHDDITVRISKGITLDSNIDSIPIENNLAYLAASKMKTFFKIKEGVHIDLIKRIPLSSGLGGASSNAATVIKSLNKLWGINSSDENLLGLAADLGSDVPFFLTGGTALVSGKGDLIEQLPNIKKLNLLLLVTENTIKNKTATMYSHVRPIDFTSGDITNKLKTGILNKNTSPSYDLFNVFDEIAKSHIPYVNDISNILLGLGINGFHVSGSGPTVFIIVTNIEKAKELKEILFKKYNKHSFLVKSQHSPNDITEY